MTWYRALAADGHLTAPPPTPLWKQGVSTWTGSTYQLPDSSAPSPTPAAASASDTPAPYTVPVDPSLYTDPILSASDNFTALPSVADLPAAPVTSSGEFTGVEESVVGSGAPAAPEVPVDPLQTDPQDPSATRLSEQLDQGMPIDAPPLEEVTRPWYQPWRWIPPGWQNHAEFGLDGSQGNAETLAMQVGVETRRKTDTYTLAFDVDYRLATNKRKNTENNGRYNIDYDRFLKGSPWSAFGKFGLEWDEFKPFDLRVYLSSGVGYHWIRNDRTTLATRFGAGASREIGAPIDDWIAEAVFGIDAERQINKRNKFKGKVDYYPAWEDFSNYRVVTDLGWEFLLDDADNLSLKFAVTDRYDSTPQGAEPNDFYYSVLMLVKF